MIKETRSRGCGGRRHDQQAAPTLDQQAKHQWAANFQTGGRRPLVFQSKQRCHSRRDTKTRLPSAFGTAQKLAILDILSRARLQTLTLTWNLKVSGEFGFESTFQAIMRGGGHASYERLSSGSSRNSRTSALHSSRIKLRRIQLLGEFCRFFKTLTVVYKTLNVGR